MDYFDIGLTYCNISKHGYHNCPTKCVSVQLSSYSDDRSIVLAFIVFSFFFPSFISFFHPPLPPPPHSSTSFFFSFFLLFCFCSFLLLFFMLWFSLCWWGGVILCNQLQRTNCQVQCTFALECNTYFPQVQPLHNYSNRSINKHKTNQSNHPSNVTKLQNTIQQDVDDCYLHEGV